jgi:hypothetical protein
MRAIRLISAACPLLALLLLAQCRRADIGGAPVAMAAAEPARPAAVAEGAVEPTPDSAPQSGDGWLDGNIYRVRMADVRPCPASPAVEGAARVGVRVHVASKIGDLLVAPRDFKLESGGVILESAIVQKAPAACGPLLAPKALRAGKSAEGIVVFDLPPGFNAEQRPVRITYQPTRWGGARRVEAVLPARSFRL